MTAKVINRAARRAAGLGKTRVRVRNQVAIVPMQHAESYFAHEIACEGKWASDRRLVIVQPKNDCRMADRDWFPKMLDRMWKTDDSELV